MGLEHIHNVSKLVKEGVGETKVVVDLQFDIRVFDSVYMPAGFIALYRSLRNLVYRYEEINNTQLYRC